MTFDSRKLYADKIYELMELESLIDKLCYWSFSESYFKFVKDEQHWITKRILIKVEGDKKITDATNIAIRMYYKDEETII